MPDKTAKQALDIIEAIEGADSIDSIFQALCGLSTSTLDLIQEFIQQITKHRLRT